MEAALPERQERESCDHVGATEGREGGWGEAPVTARSSATTSKASPTKPATRRGGVKRISGAHLRGDPAASLTSSSRTPFATASLTPTTGCHYHGSRLRPQAQGTHPFRYSCEWSMVGGAVKMVNGFELHDEAPKRRCGSGAAAQPSRAPTGKNSLTLSSPDDYPTQCLATSWPTRTWRMTYSSWVI
ncbi:hypothetical protein B296_00000399 [Ensete ventricosum]|uniref:Uncharacterized protein n=1 Tax=Ensete ventricosum TaxID=4639 RepID=A0A427BCF4_ENSVE|nr:hypothetical protein B296_00000399 [Ensete ventricosum]